MVPVLLSFALLGSQVPAENPVFPKLVKPKFDGSVLAEIEMNSPVAVKKDGEIGTVTFPIPSAYEGQKLISFKVSSSQSGSVLGWKCETRPDGLNRICEVRVKPKGKGAMVTYEAMVLLPPNPPLDSDSDAAKYSDSTACVQSKDPMIVAEAQKLAGESKSREELVYNTVQWVALNNGLPGHAFTALDAKAGMLCGGSCTNHANLCAALLRANGIPARTVSHMPTWTSEKLYEHWLTEYWKPGSGWVMVEPTLGLFRPARNTAVVLAISNESDENHAFDPVHERCSMPGSAYLSLAEFSPELYGADIVDTDAINSISIVATFPGQRFGGELEKAAAKRASVVQESTSKGVDCSYSLARVKGLDAKALAGLLGSK